MHLLRWTLVALLPLGCVNLELPPELRRKLDAGVVEVDAQVQMEDAEPDAPDLDGEADAPVADVPGDLAGTDHGPGNPAVPDAALVSLGKPCSANAQCQSSTCKDGVCCNEACAGTCFSCNVAASPGICTPVPPGQDPREDCPQDPVATCARDGTCNGLGACQRYRLGTECAPGSCTGDQERAASLCNGAGVCIPGQLISCAPMMCMNGSCAKSCTKQTDCRAGFFCDGTACRPRRPSGQPCTMAFQCASGSCADNICCNTPCIEACHSCALPSTLGTCTPTPAAMDPRSECVAEPAATCGRAGGCNGEGGCRRHPAGTACGLGASCAGAVHTAESVCNGLGVCLPGAVTSCVAYRCADSACGTRCTTGVDCQPGFTCAGESCMGLPALALYWKLDESSGTMAADASGNNLAGTFIGVTGAPAPSALAPPLLFPNPASRAFLRSARHSIQLANMPAALKPAANLTLSVWYRATSVSSSAAAGSELISGGDQYLMRLNAGSLQVSKHAATGNMWCMGPVAGHLDGNWHHAAATISATEMIVYLDGIQKMSCPNTLPITYTRGLDLWVGRHGNGGSSYDFEGNIDEVRVYTRVLSATEIAALAAGNPTPSP